MLIKVLFSAPAAALVSFVIAAFQPVDFSGLEQLSLEFVLLGRVPGTEFYLQFDHLFIVFASLIWFPAAIWAGKYVRRMIDLKINRVGEQLELVSL